MSILKPDSPDILGKKFHQIVAMAGDGKLKDNSACSQELREFLQNIDAQKLFDYVEYCLEEKFDDSGLALQDLVNELGRRLEYEVENGRYRGTRNDTGQDGIWKAADQTIIAEVKTTDAYQIKLDTIIKYKKELVEKNRVNEDASILIIVGRSDTTDLEAQIRGSRHAWEIRIISAKALCNLVDLKIESEERETTEKIRNILQPIEYTRLDGLIDIMFTAAQDRESEEIDSDLVIGQDATTSQPVETDEYRAQQQTPRGILTDIRERAVHVWQVREQVYLVARTRTQFSNPDETIKVVSLASKVYSRGNQESLWFGFRRRQLEFLESTKQGFLLLTGVGQNYGHAIDIATLKPILPKLHTTEPNRDEINQSYWHIYVAIKSYDEFELDIPNEDNLNLKPYKLKLP